MQYYLSKKNEAKMIGELYKARKGTEHIVRVIGKYREMLKGETLECTAHTYQVLAQRQIEVFYDGVKGNPFFINNDEYFPFTMEYELFLENYEETADVSAQKGEAH